MFYACLAVLAAGPDHGRRRAAQPHRTGAHRRSARTRQAARAYGVNATRTTLAAFALSGFLAAVAGALYVHQQTGLSAEPFRPEASLELFTMVVIGGLGSLPGALLGATYVHSVDFFLPIEWQFLATGAGLLLVLLVFPSGFGGVLADLRDGALRKIATRRGIVVPSLLADVRVEERGRRAARGDRAGRGGRDRRARRGRGRRTSRRRRTNRRRSCPPAATTRRPATRVVEQRRPPGVDARADRCRRRHGRGGAVVTTHDESATPGHPARRDARPTRGRRRRGRPPRRCSTARPPSTPSGRRRRRGRRRGRPRAVGQGRWPGPRTAACSHRRRLVALEAAHDPGRAVLSRSACCSGSTWSTSSTAPPSACCCPRSATTSASTTAASSPSSRCR